MKKLLLIPTLILLLSAISCQKENTATPAVSYDTLPWIVTPDASSDSIPSSTDTLRSFILPQKCSIWRGHFVALVDSISPREAYLTLLSLRDWPGMVSASNANAPTQASDTADSYSEAALDSWHIPSEEQARRLKSAYPQGSALLRQANDLFLSLGADTISLQTNSAKSRYLCQQATKSFSFCTGTNLTNAGATIKTYHLRLSRLIRLTR